MGFGEAIIELITGNADVAIESIYAALFHSFLFSLPYIGEGNKINYLSAFWNANFGIATYGGIINKPLPSKSFALNLSTIVNIIQIGTNSLEIYKKKRKEE